MVMVFWGGSFIAIKIGLRYMPAFQFVAARFLPSALLLLLITALSRERFREFRNFWKSAGSGDKFRLAAAAFFAVPAYHFCLNKGETIIPAGWASLVIALNPASIAIMAALFLKEPIGFRRWIGVSVAFLGILYIALTHDLLADDGTELPVWTKLLGIAITLGAVASWGAHSVLVKRLTAGHDHLIVLTWILGLGALFLLPFTPLEFYAHLPHLPVEFWWALLFLSVGCTVGAFIIWYWALRNWQASRAGAFIYLVPLFALFGSRWMLNEPLDVNILIGALGVLGGVILAGSKTGKRQP